jgi:hypothetical protein
MSWLDVHAVRGVDCGDPDGGKGEAAVGTQGAFCFILDVAGTDEHRTSSRSLNTFFPSLLAQKASLRSGQGWEGGGSFSKTGVKDLAGAGGEEKVSTGREEEKAEKENTLQLTAM